MNEHVSPTVSVITPTFNAEQFIGDTIQSVQNQTFTDWEMIIIDDSSTDRTVETVKKYIKDDDRIRIIERSENGGPAKTRNAGLKATRGRYIAFLDSDDEWLDKKLAVQLEYMQKTQTAFTHTAYERVQIHTDQTKVIKPVAVPSIISYKQLLKRNVIGCLTVMIDTKQTGDIQMPDIRSRQDYALWLELTRKGFEAHGINEVLANYHVRLGSVSSNKWNMAKQNWRVYRDVEKLSFPIAAWYFTHYAFLKTKEYMHYIKKDC
ncbi:teichuronic acid biosynthesis glycosyltransferase TuaG [Pelagirhabdus alkalitolerans]|uniref:Teichuronic acid biosynthesis glycosyltransferase TuaG n=1 Tax=Pelagirhabdus alkalitolerans TaxID=1612202 RepID=A0A1G6GH64_9BACI|nr:glycosyltransferase family 2 protein [Pelagirhabdus alkalitolerans]SDB81294.1 teichuronic acid biosynthesis glycosyltransferase TuaG [Pelagirhabdus alkalitolerans]